jgi:NAD(P)H-nitrite reductase large subunit
MIGAHIHNAGIDLRTETELAEIHGNERGEAIAVTTNKGERIDCQFVGLTAGVHPNIQWLRDSALELDRGILVDKNLKTNVDDVYAIGDCAQMRSPSPGRRPVEAVWYTGRMMGETVAYNICGNKIAYEPGIWFNSAKFIHIEYQIYGTVPAKLASNQDSLFWQHPDGEKSIRIVYDHETQHVLGFNLLGIRFRQEVCEKWIREQTYLPEVITNLEMARFDPEFYPFYQKGLIEAYEERFNRKLSTTGKFSLNRVIRLLKPSS